MKGAVLVTGGSRGIGAATSRKLAEAGYTVCINYRANSAAAQNLVNEITEAGGKAILTQADISVEAEVLNMFRHIDAKYEGLVGLVNNAAVIAEAASLVDMSAERMTRLFRINVIGTMLCAREAVKRMSTQYGQVGGSIVNISSGASKLGAPHVYLDYAATKGAIDTFTIGLAKEVATEGIRVNAIRPGFIDTEIHQIPGRLQQVAGSIPMQRAGQPEEIAEAVLWLLSDKASYTTGAILDVAGGK
ncbi:MAG: SDR family oxidoreductase [Bacteroidota bacterium]